MSRKILFVVFSLAVLAAVGALYAQAPAASWYNDPQITALREEARQLVISQQELSWKRYTTGEQVDIAATYQGHDKLFSPDTVKLFDQAIAATADPTQKRALEFFRLYVLSEIVNMRVASLSDEVENYLSDAQFEFGGQTHAYYDFAEMLQNEADYARRQELSNAVVPILRKANDLLSKREERMQRLAKEMGFEDYNALSGQLRHCDLPALANVCRQFLRDTDKMFAALIRWATPYQLNFPAEKLRRCDLPRLLQNLRYEKYFPQDQIAPRMTRFLGGMGLSIDKVKIDDADRPKKNPRAACFPIVVPGDVRITIKPTGGQDDYGAFWHEMGHAQHFANSTTEYWEFQQLGDNVTTENYAFLFDEMMGNRVFGERFLNMDKKDLPWHVRFTAFTKLYIVRRYCGKLLYEIELHRGAADPQAIYREQLGRAYGFKLDENDGLRYLVDIDDFFYSADYLRAWMLEAMLEARLAQKFGEDWFTKVEAGDFLRGLWQAGNYYGGDELAQHFGYAGIGPQRLIERIKKRISID